jgi:hypothetical protein
VKIVDVITLQSCGPYAGSAHWRRTRKQIHQAVKRCEWPVGSGSFTIGELKRRGWVIEGKAKNALAQELGDFDAVLPGPEKPIVVEWETGNISSSHRSMNKLTMLVSCGVISAGILVVPSRKLYAYLTDRIGNVAYLTDRIGNVRELEPYFGLWKSVPCDSGVLELVVIEHDAESYDVPRIPKMTAGRAGG